MNILLIEDDAGLVELITVNLEELGFSVMSAESGAEALAYLSKQTPDLMLLDYSLPDINGKELIETLNKQQAPLPPFIITTGQGDERIAVDMMKLGAKDYLIKDILFLERLPDVVKRAIKEVESGVKLKQAEKALQESEESIKELVLQTSSKTGQAFFNSTTKTLGNIIKADYTFIGKYIGGTKSVETISLTYKGKDIENFAYELKDTPCDKVINQGLCVHKSDVAKKFPNDILLTDMGIQGYIGVPLYNSDNKPQGILVALYENEIEDIELKESLMQFFASRTETELERHEIEISLKASEERFRNAITYAPFAIMIHSEGKVLQLSEEWTKQTGYTIDDITTIKEWTLKAYGADAVPSNEFIENLYKINKTQYDGEWEVKIKDGSYRLWDFSSSPIGESLDGKKMVISMAADITERKHAEKTLKDERDKFNFILSELPIGVSVADADHNFIYINPVSNKIDGYPKKSQNIIGANVLSVHPKNSQLKVEQLLKDFESGEHSFFQREAKRGKRTVDISYHALRDSQKKYLGMVRLVSDITHNKQAEIALKDSEERFELAMTATKDGLFDWNLETNEIYYSPGWKRMLGYEDNELPNDFSVWEKLTKPEDAENLLKILQELISKELDRFELEMKLKHKEGHWVDILSRAEIFYDENGKAVRMVGTHVDITERKQEEKILDVELKLFEYAINHSQEELLQKFLDEAEKLTNSNIGFFHFIEDDQESISLQTWSTNTLSNMCKGLGEASRHYPISKAGVWVDCVKERKPVVHNDYLKLAHKKGLPEGHAPIIRELVVPVIRGNQIKAVLGVGNKKTDYNEADVNTIQRLADVAWETVVRKQAEEKTQAAEEKYRIMIETSNDLIWMLDHEGNFTFLNAHAEKATGYLLKDLKGKSFIPLVMEDELPFLNEVFTKTMSGESVSYEMKLKTVYGETLILAVNTAPLSADDEVQAICSFARDITHQKEAEQLLKESEKRFKALHNASFGGIAIHDMGIIVDCNQGLSTISGYTFEELIGMDGLLCIAEDSRKIVRQNIKASNEKAYEVVGLRKNGEEYPLRIEGAMIPSEGKDMRVVEFRDITEQKRAEEKIRTTEEHLKNTFDLSPSIICKVNLSTGYFIEVNKAVTRILDYSIDEFTSIPFIELIHPDDRQKTIDAATEQLKGKDVTFFENRYLCKDGSYKWMAWHGTKADENGIVTANGSDITERKLAESKLRNAERKNLVWLESSPACTKIVDLDFNLKYMSSSGIKGLNIEDITPYYDKPYPFYFFPEYFRNTMTAKLELVKKTGKTETHEAPVEDVDGSALWFHATIVPLNDADGQLEQIMIVSNNITERKTMEQEIVKTKQFYENITEGVQDGIWVSDKNDVIFYANSAMEKIVGMPREQIQGKNVLTDFPEDTTGEFNKIYKQAKKEKNPVWYLIKITKSGNKITWENGWLIPQYQGKVFTGIICTIRDVTKRKLAEGDVRRLSTAVEQSPAMVVITNTEGVVEYVNPKFTELTGYSNAVAIGQKSNILKSGEQDTVFYKKMWEVVDSGEVWRGQFHNKKKNGELFWEAASISAILNEAGEVINFIKIGEDITQQKNTETKLKLALENALQSDRLKSAFLANMSHEIRTPMNGILGFINLLNEPDLSPSEVGEYSAIINKSGDRLLNTINDIIDISKIEAGEVLISTSEVAINNEIEELYSFFSLEVKRKGLSLIVEPSLSSEDLRVDTDGHKLHGILTNLIKNAIKYTEQGSITFGYLQKEKCIEFYVKDTGIGIPKNRVSAIFNRFEQADIADTRVFEGSGLGLAIAKAYVEMLGGEISVKSDEGKGTIFTFTIPYTNKVEKVIEQVPENSDTKIARVKDLNLLIVEDDDVSSELLKMILKDNFRKIIFASNGIEAIEMCENNPEIDLVLMDIKMPKMDGLDATKEIRKFNKELLIIAQTAYALPRDKEKAIAAGCNDYIAKPINKKLLMEMINELLN